MIVGKRMTPDPVTVGPRDSLAVAQSKMTAGKFRRLPVVDNGTLVGIITDRDMRQHVGHMEQVRVDAAMTEELLTVTPADTLEHAAKLMLRSQISGLPVLEGDNLVGILTSSDVLKAFLEVMGVSEEGVARIDVTLEAAPHDLADASKIIAAEGGEILGVGTYREKWQESRIFYLVIRTKAAERIANVLRQNGFSVLGVY